PSLSPHHPTAPTPTYTLSLHDALPISPYGQWSPSLPAGLLETVAQRLLTTLPDYTCHWQLSPRITLYSSFILSLIQSRSIIDIIDRKSTRLNSSHVKISYAVFCLKKKK